MFTDDDDDQVKPVTVTPASSPLPWWTAAIGLGVVILGGLIYFQSAEVKSLRQDITQIGLAQAKENAALRAIFAKSDQDLQGVLKELRAELATTRQESSDGVKQAQAVVSRRVALVAGQLENRQKESSKQFTEELAKVRESHDDASVKLNSISSEVGAVKTEMESNKSSIQETRADLQRVRGDLGMMSGLVATNSKEIQILREMGDRDIFEFTLVKSAGLQQVGDVRLMLKKADTNKNRYTLELLSEDKRVEKKDKGVNEPVQFYNGPRVTRQPYELVVNEVRKNTIVGYLARPKTMVAEGRGK